MDDELFEEADDLETTRKILKERDFVVGGL
jgi:hypothetical protein